MREKGYIGALWEKTSALSIYLKIHNKKPLTVDDLRYLAEYDSESFEWRSIENILDNLKRLEINDIPVSDVDADKVKNLLGNS